MSRAIICDKCHVSVYADSRSDRGDYCAVSVQDIKGSGEMHLCKVCRRQFYVEFLRMMTAEEYDDEYGRG